MSIRLRLGLVFACAAAAVIAFGGWLFVTTLSSSLLASIDSQLSVQIAQGSKYLGSAGTTNPTLGVASNPPEYAVQLIDGANRVRAASEEAGNRPILSKANLNRARAGRVFVTQVRDGEHERVVARPFDSRRGWVVLAGVSLETFDRTTNRVIVELAIGGSVFVLMAALGAFGLAGAALRPVEKLRAEVAVLAEHRAPGEVTVPSTRDEIADLAKTMNDLLLRLRQALEREQNLVADASHELRTPFAILRGELELASRPGRSREELVAAVKSASEEAARLNLLADDLLLLSRSDQGQLILRIVPTDVTQLLNQCAQRATGRAQDIGVTCRVDAPAGLSWPLDPDRIGQAIDNLIDNAMRQAPPETEIVIGARAENGRLILEVADEGPGFPAEFLPHAFERFRRPDASRSRGDGGAGLGLSIVQAVATAHGGAATAMNLSVGGACVRLEILGGHPASPG